ncbi:MAG: DEAD/DEAH box helicase [Hyphomicrobiales bacterium]|nr:DEAD/DEAH box helicase [Hyphomicrobiales bacterium]
MEFRIADTFTDALARLPAADQKAVKTSAFDLQTNPEHPGLQMHRIEQSKDRNFWSVRVSRDIRIIVHKTEASMLLAYVDHHDKAYQWAERRRIEAHPRTGAIQIVEVRERVEEIALPLFQAAQKPAGPPPPFAALSDDDLMSAGVPQDWLADVRAASEDGFLDLAPRLPAEAAESLLQFATTGELKKPAPAPADPFAHPDALRRFRVVENVEELRQALDYPWDKWMVFLHPSQRDLVQRNFSGPARAAGSAGTGKTVVALHRAVRLAQSSPDARVLLTTFSDPLAAALEQKVRVLAGPDAGVIPRIRVASLNTIAAELHELAFGQRSHVARDELVARALEMAGELVEPKPNANFVRSEWANVVDAWQVGSVEDYLAVPRLGRKMRLGSKQRERLWPVFAAARRTIEDRGFFTWPRVFSSVADFFAKRSEKPFTHIVVDEAQDLGVPELRFLAAISGAGENALFFAGDLGQRIFQQPFSWSALGIDIRGRSTTLKVNYRTSHQIRRAADRLLPASLRDVDGVQDNRKGTVSVFNGPEPSVVVAPSEVAEIEAVVAFVKAAVEEGIDPGEIGLFVRTPDLLSRARAVVKVAGFECVELTDRGHKTDGRIAIGTMHLAKGLEFKVVAVVACDDDALPLRARVEAAADEVELEDVYETERQLLYVAATRARDRLMISATAPGSEYLQDFAPADP